MDHDPVDSRMNGVRLTVISAHGAQTLILASLDAVDEQPRPYVIEAMAANTRRAYRSDWRIFTTWCDMHGLAPLPAAPSTVARFLTAQAATLKVASLHRRLAAIVQAHRAAGYASPSDDATVRTVWRGIRRTKGTATAKKRALLTSDIRALLAVLPNSPSGARDRALLLLGFAGALRRSELVALDVDDIEAVEGKGLLVRVRRSQTDQKGRGIQVPIHPGSDPLTCPVQALAAWLAVAGITEGPIFRPVDRHQRIGPGRLTAQTVALIVKRAATAAGLDPARFAGDSLRAGFATSAAIAGAELPSIMCQTRHRSATAAAGYVRDADPFRGTAAVFVTL